MSTAHMGVLYSLLGLLGLSLVGPGLAGAFRPGIGRTWLIAEAADARNHLRGLNAMMAALGMVALWACWDLERSRPLVLALGIVMAVLVVARVYSLLIDGRPGGTTLTYLAVEILLAAVFLLWPPPPVG
ncbi:MAG: DUF4345 domain-containing protein [Kiloniellaceae bacterium]